MVRVEKEIRIHKGGRVVRARALFDTGSRGSYFSDKLAEKIGYEPYEVAREVGLAVEGKTARVIGRTAVFIEVDGYLLPEEETIGVVEGLRVDAIIGLNLMEKYGIYVERDELKFKEIPPSSAII
jgi:hypothetical protein